jgi:hypothetical protein
MMVIKHIPKLAGDFNEFFKQFVRTATFADERTPYTPYLRDELTRAMTQHLKEGTEFNLSTFETEQDLSKLTRRELEYLEKKKQRELNPPIAPKHTSLSLLKRARVGRRFVSLEYQRIKEKYILSTQMPMPAPSSPRVQVEKVIHRVKV